jgi:hypothetical protein
VDLSGSSTSTLDVKAMPNPTTDYFNLVISSKDANTTSNVRVFDKMGTLVEAYQQVPAGKVLRMGSNWAGGIYIVEVTQNGQRKTIKLIKTN